MKVIEILNEASTPQRAWQGKLKRVDAILGWMYDKNILSAGDKKKKDSVFRQYYRYYNDGDMPAALKVKGISKWDGSNKVETELEKYLETFIKEMLSKYMSKVNRTEFRLDRLISELGIVSDVAGRGDAHGLLNYWLKKTKIKDEKGELPELIEKLQKSYDLLYEKLNDVDPDSNNKVLSYRKEMMEKNGNWDDECDLLYKILRKNTDRIKAFVDVIIEGAKKLKDELKK